MHGIFGLPSALAHSVLAPAGPTDGSNLPASFDSDEVLTVSAYSSIVQRNGVRTPGTGGIDPTSVPLLTLSMDMLLILAIDPTTLQIVAQIDGERSVEQITIDSQVGEGDVVGVLWDLVEAKMIAMTDPGNRVARCA